MADMTLGQHLLADMFPPDVYRPGQSIDKKTADQLFGELARRHPEKYRDISHKALLLGSDVARSTGGASFGIRHLMATPRALGRRNELKRRIAEILDTVPEKEQNQAIVKAIAGIQKDDPADVVKELEELGNPFALQLKGAGRGNPASVARLLASDLMYAGPDGKPIPIPVLRSYSQGLSPAEYVASTFGARKGVSESKLSVASSGYLSKLLLGAAHRMVVTGNDAEDALQAEAEQRGLPVETEDPDNVGAYLAKAIGPYKRNTPLTPKIMAHIKKLGHDEILVRSPITSSDPNGGIFAADVGIRERGQLPQVGEAVGIAAAGSLSEPLQQAGLSAKHSGGIAEDQSDELEGFELIEKLINPPKDFREAATHAELDGRISGISKAPQGGQYIKIGEKEHYVPEGRALRVQPGDIVEAGDQLTDGIANPRMVIYHKGLGEGARVLTNTLRDGIRNSGIRVHRRNLELITRGLVDRVRMTAEHDEYSPDDIVPYSQLAARWTPRPEAATRNLESVAGKYLESPVLHYTIGTRVTPSVVNKLKQYGIKQVMVHNDPPPFEPEATRGIDLLRTDPDWMTRQMGTGLTKGLLQGIHRGAEADEVSTSFAASRARAVDFGRKGFFQLKPPLPPPSDFDLKS